MTENNQESSKNFLKDRILRYKPIVFLRRNIFLFSFLAIFLLTILFGVWDIRSYEIYDLDGDTLKERTQEQVREYIEENIFGQNYFRFLPLAASEDMYLVIAELKKVRIEKVMPNKVVLFVEVYQPKYSAFLKGQGCKVLAEDGTLLDEVCEDSEEECCKEYALENSLIYFRSPDVEVSMFDAQKHKLLVMEEIAKVVKVIGAFKYEIERIELKNNIVEVLDNGGRVFRFTIADNIDIQLKRFMIVVTKIKSEYMEVGTLDLRFDRPVMLE